MSLGEFEPDVWIPSAHPAARRGAISLAELVPSDVIPGRAGVKPGTYDAWTQVMRTLDPDFEFTDPTIGARCRWTWLSRPPRTGQPPC